MDTERTWRGRVLDLATVVLVVGALGCARLVTRFRLPRKWMASEGIQATSAGSSPLQPFQVAVMRRLRWMVPRIARRVPWKAVCLEQALAAHWMLGRLGVPSLVRIGVALDGEDLAAHAWLEVRGKVFIGQVKDLTFTAFDGALGS